MDSKTILRDAILYFKRAEKITGTGGKDKEIAFGMVERGGKVVTGHVGSRTKKELQGIIRDRVEAGSAIFSDELEPATGWKPNTNTRLLTMR
jgi:hypothetical protein